jgi:hypothetical protein
MFPIERIHSRACTGICEQHKCRNEDNQPLWLFPVLSDSTGSGSVCSSWLELLQFLPDKPARIRLAQPS